MRLSLQLAALSACLLSGCAAIPEVVHEPHFHNPFPQLHRVAVLPFFNQSADPTVDSDAVAMHYYNELQQIPGFEVMPVGVARRIVEASGVNPQTGPEFQELARQMGVDAVIVGSVTEYSPYYPPRMGLAVRWYAANPGFHPIPPGYGLPWGTPQQQEIPESQVFEAEFALAKQQLLTQTPDSLSAPAVRPPSRRARDEEEAAPAEPEPLPQPASADATPIPPAEAPHRGPPSRAPAPALPLPPDWPDPRGLIPPPPEAQRPPLRPQPGPVLSSTRLYHGNDADFTRKLEDYFYFRDDARFGGWQAYLERSDDFIRFCCYLHITEMLAARGGSGESRVVWRWPIGR